MRNAMLGFMGVMMSMLGACEALEPDNEVSVESASLGRGETAREVLAPRAPSLTGRVTIDDEELIAAPWADIMVQPLAPGEVADAPPQQGFRHAPIEVQSDEGGFFSVATLPEGASAAELSVFVDGELAHTETIEVVNGKVERSIAVAVALGAWGLCVGSTWGSVYLQYRGDPVTDKFKHCVSSCRTQRFCGGSLVAGAIKEIIDTLCQSGPQWLKNLLNGISSCGGWDNADMLANVKGLECAYKWKTCASCCDAIY